METNVCCKDGVNITINVNCGCRCGGENTPEPPTPEAPKIYGIRIDKNNPDPAGRITYTNDAVGMKPAFMNFETGVFDYGDWKDVWFVKENKPVMLNYDGTEAYELDPDDYSKKLDGMPSDVANPGFPGNAMAKMPLVWMKSWEDDQYEYYNVCQTRPDETYHANAFTRADGSVAGCKYLRMFSGSVIDGQLRSLSGQRPAGNQTAIQEISRAQANGQLWYTTAYSEWDLLGFLLRLLSKSDDSQKNFGNGQCDGGMDAPNLLSAGTLDAKGQFFGYATQTQQVKIFHMEAWWGTQWQRIAGLINKVGSIFVKPSPPYNTTGDGYLPVDISPSGVTGENCVATKTTSIGRFPISASGNGSQYACDGLHFNNLVTSYAAVGGSCSGYKLKCGALCLLLVETELSKFWDINAGLSCEQPKTV